MIFKIKQFVLLLVATVTKDAFEMSAQIFDAIYIIDMCGSYTAKVCMATSIYIYACTQVLFS